MLLANIIGQLPIINPYTNQPATPKLNKLYIGSDTPDKSRVFQEWRACGTNAYVVKNADK